ALVRSIYEEEEAVVYHPFAVFVGYLQGLPVEHKADGAGPFGSPGFIGEFIAVGIEPGDVADHANQVAGSFLADFAILKELAAVKIGMGEAQVDELAGEIAQALAALIQVPVEPADLTILAVAVVIAVLR